MSSTTFQDFQTPILASWLNDVNGVAYSKKFPDATHAQTAETLATPTGSSLVGFQQSGTGAVAWTVQDKARESVSVLDFGADPTGVTDSSAAFQAASNTGKAIYIPTGIYKANFVHSSGSIIRGDGGFQTILNPWDSAVAIITARRTTNWSYSAEVHGIRFDSGAIKTGVGYTFGRTNPAAYVTGDEFFSNTKFFGCWFTNMDKGVQFPFGNIGTEFYSCGFSANKYGVYALNNKYGAIMHAGNKTFYGGQFDTNECAIYIDNQCDGFGGFGCTDVIFEYNNLVCNIYNTYNAVSPIQFKNCWNEQNGAILGPVSVNLDQWSGSTKTTHSVSTTYPWMIYSDAVVIENGLVAGLNMTKAQSVAYLKGCRLEQSAGYGGEKSSVLSDSCRVYYEDCQSASGVSDLPQFIDRGYNYALLNDSTLAQGAGARMRYQPRGYLAYSSPGSGGNATKFDAALAYAGTYAGVGTLIADSFRYSNCNQFSINFLATSEWIRPTPTLLTTSAGSWYAYSFDIKVTAGAIFASITDLGANTFGSIIVPADSQWHTVGGVCYSPNAANTGLYFGGAVSNATWRVSSYQMKQFASQGEALEFLKSGVFLAP